MPDAPGPNVPFPPMEAELVSELPAQGGWRYEPKWDGFRGVLENDGGELALWSRNGRPLLRYFPELREVGELLPAHSALDGEIVITREGKLDFDAMQMRLHPAESRVRKLSAEIPATFVAFDLLLWKGKPVHEQPIEKRRDAAREGGEGNPPLARERRRRTGSGLAADAAGRRLRRRDREEAGAAVPARLARRRREGEAVQDGGLCGRRRALQGRNAEDDRDPPPRALCRRRSSRLRRLGRRRREAARRDRSARVAAARRRRTTAASRSRIAGARASSRSRR